MKFKTALSNLGNYYPEPTTLEINETEITGIYHKNQQKYSYPRHITQLESPSHRGSSNTVSQITVLPKICNLSLSPGKPRVNAAVDILQYQLSDRALRQNHFDNMRRSLQRRLQAAKASGNKELIDLLNEEVKQLKTLV
ncbi:MAG: hypothetical protein ACFCU5_05475 [Pleurocapsa sp.]